MANLLKTMYSLGMTEEHFRAIDWFLMDNKFDNISWTSGLKAKLTKKLKKLLPLMSCSNGYEYSNVKKFITEKATRYNPKIQMTSGGAECEDLIRHIRNGIAHSHAEIMIRDGEPYIRLVDYSKSKSSQSAFMFIPFSYLEIITDSYKSIL